MHELIVLLWSIGNRAWPFLLSGFIWNFQMIEQNLFFCATQKLLITSYLAHHEKSSQSHLAFLNMNQPENRSPVRKWCGILDLLGEGELVTANTGTHCIHAIDVWEFEAFRCDKIYRNTDLKVFVQVFKVFQHVGVLGKWTGEEIWLWERQIMVSFSYSLVIFLRMALNLQTYKKTIQ